MHDRENRRLLGVDVDVMGELADLLMCMREACDDRNAKKGVEKSVRTCRGKEMEEAGDRQMIAATHLRRTSVLGTMNEDGEDHNESDQYVWNNRRTVTSKQQRELEFFGLQVKEAELSRVLEEKERP